MNVDRVRIDAGAARWRWRAMGLALSCIGVAAQAQPAGASPTRSLAATCAACHGTDGRAAAGHAMPALAGLARERIAAELRAFREGSRAGTVMPQIAKGYSDAQIDALAAYFSGVPAGSAP
jgi:cytochrome c553